MGRTGSRKRRRKQASEPGGLFGRLGRALRGFLFGDPAEGEVLDRAQEIKGLLMVGLSIWLLISLSSYYTPFDDPLAEGRNWGGRLGFHAAGFALSAAGLAGYLIGVLACLWGVILVARHQVAWASLRMFGAISFVLSVAFLLQLALGERLPPNARLPYGPGGWIALEALPFLQDKFGVPGLWVLLVLTTLVSFMLATEMAFVPAIQAFVEWARDRREERGESVLKAVWVWTCQLARGLWDFVRGAGLEDVALAGTGGAAAGSVRKPRAAKRKAAPAPVEEDEEDWDDEEPEAEYDEEDEYEEEEYDEDEEPEDDEEEWDEEEVDEDEEYEDEDEYEEEDEDEPELTPAPKPAAKPAAKAKKAVVSMAKSLPFDPPSPPKGPWKYPPLELLLKPERDLTLDNRRVEDSANKLEHVLQSFRVDAQVVGAQVGPTVTLYELEVSQGTRMNKVTQLSQEIAAALRAQSVRISAPIPGKSTVGIEVPNGKRRRVRMSELISKEAYDKSRSALPMFLGMDAEGYAIVEDLARMPHLLVAGTTGSGKSVCINTILASVLLTRSPHDVQLILIDPKMVELQAFAEIPHLMLPVVTDMRQATNVLNWAVEKMEGRYELFKDAGVRNIKSFNALSEKQLEERMGDNWNPERTPRHVPYIVIVIDEFADLMMVSKKEAEQAITRLAQKSRAVGIHVVLATQRPSTDVITGVIKGNLPTRIAFQVASKVDSRVIIDHIGAEKLLGGGDMLYNPPQSSRIKRVQGALVEDAELQGIIDYVNKEAAPSFNQELVQVATGTAQPGSGDSEEPADELWDDAVRVILKSRRGSASLLQRALGIGYTRASRLIDMMTDAGIVGAHKGSKAREVLLTLEDWEEQRNASPEGV